MESVKRYNDYDVGMCEWPDGHWVKSEDFDRRQAEYASLLGEHEDLLEKFNKLNAENLSLQQRLTVQDQRVDDQKQRIASIVGKTTQCKACGSDALFWFAHIKNHSTVQHNRLNTNDVTCLLVLGCADCSETLMTVSADKLAERMTAALKPTDEAESHEL